MDDHLREVGEIEGLESLPRKAARMGWLRLLQPTSMSEYGEVGEWVLGRELISHKEFRCRFIAYRPIRQRFIRGDFREGIDCWSPDRLFPAREVEAPYSDRCGSCPESMRQGDILPFCRESYVIVGMELATGRGFFLRAGGEAVRIYEDFAIGLRSLPEPPRALTDVVVTLGSKLGDPTKGKYYLPTIEYAIDPPSDSQRDLLSRARIGGLIAFGK